MADEKVKQRENEIISMVSDFSDEYLDEELKDLCVKLCKKLGRKHEVPFKRGKLEIWASGIVYAISQLNFVFDNSFEPYITVDDICNYFKTKKSTSYNKARDIRKLLNLKPGNKEFSTELVLNTDLSNLDGDLSQLKTLRGARTQSSLMSIGSIIREIGKFDLTIEDVRNDELENLIHEIFDSPGKYIEAEDIEKVLELVSHAAFIAPACGAGILYIGDTKGGQSIPAFTSMDRYNLEFEGGHIKPVVISYMEIILYLKNEDLDGVVINPSEDNFFLTKDWLI